MPRLLGEGSEVPMTDWQLSWVVSVIEFGGVLTPVPAALLADKWGRKPLLLLSGPLNLAAWIIVLASKSVLGLFASRFIQGMAMGIMFSVLPVYLAEIASTELRGSLGIFVQYCWHLGLIFEYSIGPFLNVDQVAWASLPSSLVNVPSVEYHGLSEGTEQASR
ncbi:hypothetical protein AAG570_004764 [Ranatra chinensis]|uniref:Major facilitator superfamily (MFS) profile domain-containing protein n=1 Tax=Ranatra chinensis TaxID=642074 RepID=A0ABD0YEE7_9HEMI